MKSWKQPPTNSLIAKYVDCYWFLQKTSSDTGVDHPKLNPDPSGTLILAPKDQRYHYELHNNVTNGMGCHILMPNTSVITMDHAHPFLILGIKFNVGALYSLKFNQAYALVNDIVDNEDCLPTTLSRMSRQTLLNNNTEQITHTCHTLDQWLLPWIKKCHEDQHSELVRQIVSLVGTTPINEIGQTLNCSQRTAERAFRRVTGITMKQYASMIRFEALLAYLHQTKENQINWADISAQFDFSDQPHLIRYLKATLSVTPMDYLKQRNITIDVYGNFE
jgi:AraC-like DNA-binding protein